MYDTAYVFGEGDSGRSRRISREMIRQSESGKEREGRTEDPPICRVGSNGVDNRE